MQQETMNFIPKGDIIFYGMDLSKGHDETAYWLYNSESKKYVRITEEEYEALINAQQT